MTLLFHCDESYDERYHLHLGLLSTGDQVAAAEQDHYRLLSELLWDHSISCSELHGHQLFAGKEEWKGVATDHRIDVYKRALSIIPQHGIEVLYRGIDLDGYRAKYRGSSDPRGDAFSFMFGDLLTKHLVRRSRDRNERVLVVTDQQHQYADRLRRAHSEARSSQPDGEARIIDACHFVDSSHSPLVQLADLAAFIQRRRILVPEEGDKHAEQAMAMLAQIVEDSIPGPRSSYSSVHRQFT